MKYKKVKQEAFGHMCRSCINAKYHASLKTEDCVYLDYEYKCKHCGKMKHIVVDVRFTSRWKLI